MIPTTDDALLCHHCGHERWAHADFWRRCLADRCACERFVWPPRPNVTGSYGVIYHRNRQDSKGSMILKPKKERVP